MFYDRFSSACKMRNTAPTTVVRAVACSSGMIDGWKKGSFPRSDVVARIADHLDVSADYLLERTDEPATAGGDLRQLNEKEVILIDGFRSVDSTARDLILKMVDSVSSDALKSTSFFTPKDVVSHRALGSGASTKPKRPLKRVEGTAAAGVPITAVPERDLMISVPSKYLSDDYFIVRAHGDSMINADINDGDFCVFQRDAYRDSGRIMLAQVDGATDEPEGTIKRVFSEGDTVELRPSNRAYASMYYPASEVDLVGVLVDVLSPGN